ncbi:hypothetical protein TWF718_001201 [Orbilia javanica]|uniref:RDRP core domain-containing protein n=1 Tax=Orbilia javanica TaxID=47235 RepID=A0AAN8N562_9PEZI
MSSTSEFVLPENLTFQEVFHELKSKFGFPLPPEKISADDLDKERFNFFARSKFLLTYGRRNFAAAIREFEIFANFDNLAEETLSRASDVQSIERRQAAIQKRRIRAFNQELEKQLQIFYRDGGSIATQRNPRSSVLSAGGPAVTVQSDHLIKNSEKDIQILRWRERSMAAANRGGSDLTSRSGLRSRESCDLNEINDAFPFHEEPTEVDIDIGDSGLYPVHLFRGEAIPGALPETSFRAATNGSNIEPDTQSHIRDSPSGPLGASIHSPPKNPVKTQNRNWGTYHPPPETLTSQPTITQVPKPSAVHTLNSKSTLESNPFAPSVSSKAPTQYPHIEDTKKRKQNQHHRNVIDRPSKRQSPIPQDQQKPVNAQPKLVQASGASAKTHIRQSYSIENQIPADLKNSKAGHSFETDITEESFTHSMLRSRDEYQGTQPTSFNSTMEGKIATPGRYDDISDDHIPPTHKSRNRNPVGAVYASHTTSFSSVNSTNGSRPVMRGRGGNRPASPSTQLHMEEEEASSRDTYSVGRSTLDGMRTLDVTQSRQQSPPTNRSANRAPSGGRPPPSHNGPTPEPTGGFAQPRSNLARSSSGRACKLNFYKTLSGESFPGDNYHELFNQSQTPFWLQWEVQRMILATHARDKEADAVPRHMHDLLNAFIDKSDMGYEDAQNQFKSFWSQFTEEKKYNIPNIKRESYAAILRSENGWDNKIQLSAELVLDRVTSPNKSSPESLRPSLRLRALNLRPTSTRFDRKFGSDRFMLLRVPKITPPNSKRPNENHSYDALANYLSQEGFEFLGRRWRAICHRSSTKDENGKRISLAKQDKSLAVIVIMFAESGPGLAPVDQRAAVEWLVPISKNLFSSQCKLYARIALGFSTTTPSVVFEENEIDYKIKDIVVHGSEPDESGELPKYSLTDGCGLVSPAVLREVARHLGLPYPPSAVQARIGAAKGLWIMDPSIPLHSSKKVIRIRPDQNKFKGISLEPEHRTLDICNTSKPLTPSALNLQFLIILLHNGVTEATLEKLLRDDIKNEVTELFRDGSLDDGASLRKYLERVKLNSSRRGGKATSMKGRIPLTLAERAVDLINAGFTLQNLTLKTWFETILFDHCEKIKEKMRIRVARSCQPYCVPDPTGTLKKGQVYLRFGPESKFIDPKTMMAIDVLRGDVLVGRNPAHFASDVQKVKAVDVPELRYLTDVIVFPADPESKDRSLADYLSGGDYDGDRVWTCWDEDLVEEFENQSIHGPSTVSLDEFLATDNRLVFDDFKTGTKSKDAFSSFIERHLRTAMDEEILGQCTTFFDKVVYKNYENEEGALNLDEVKRLGLACGKLVDAPKQGVRLKPGYWETVKDWYKHLQMPYYKMSANELKKRDPNLRNARESDHPIDKLKFRVAEDEIQSLLNQFQAACGDAQFRDGDLVRYSDEFFARCDTDMESEDEFRKGMAKALLHQKNHLNRRLDELKVKWGQHWAGRDLRFEDEKDAETTRTLIEECVRLFDNILPCEFGPDNGHIGKTLVSQWKTRERDPFSDWNRAKTSLLHFRATQWNDSSSTLPWFVAGDIMCFEKWRIALETSGRRSGFVAQPISSVSRIKASALKKEAEERNWLSGRPTEDHDNQDDSDDDSDF